MFVYSVRIFGSVGGVMDISALQARGIRVDTPNQLCGLKLLSYLPPDSLAGAFFDPQYQGVLEHLQFGTTDRQTDRRNLSQMPQDTIIAFIASIASKLRPTGHLFLWVDKFHLCQGYQHWVPDGLFIVDMLVWDKVRIGQGFRTRYQTEYLIILQKSPKTTKGMWEDRSFRDIWRDKKPFTHTHSKPVALHSKLIELVSAEGDWFCDPASGGYTTLSACERTNRRFIGCDLELPPFSTGELQV